MQFDKCINSAHDEMQILYCLNAVLTLLLKHIIIGNRKPLHDSSGLVIDRCGCSHQQNNRFMTGRNVFIFKKNLT